MSRRNGLADSYPRYGIVDTVFVCRSTGATARQWLAQTTEELVSLVANELDQLRDAGMQPSAGDARCIVYGHMARMTVWRLRPSWNVARPTSEKLRLVAEAFASFGDPLILIERCRTLPAPDPRPGPLFTAVAQKERKHHAVSF